MNDLQERIKAGLDGKFKGLANGFKRLNNYIFGVQRGIITLIGGSSGTGKSTLLDFIVQHAIQDAEAKGITLNVFYNSFEIDKMTKKCNWLSVQIFNKYGIIVPPEKIKGFGDNRLTEKEQELVNAEIPEVNRIFDKINWNFKPENPTGLYNSCWKHMEKRGKFIKEDYIDVDGKTKQKITGFINNNPDEYNWMVTDHLYLCKKERSFNVKQNIDKLSEYQVDLARLFNFTFTNLQQFNQGLSSTERAKFKGVDLSPSQGDFRDSTNPFSDSDICIGLMNPYKLDMDTCLGYDLKKLKDRFILLKICKNRLSSDNISIGLLSTFAAGYLEELPHAKDMTIKDYEKYINK